MNITYKKTLTAEQAAAVAQATQKENQRREADYKANKDALKARGITVLPPEELTNDSFLQEALDNTLEALSEQVRNARLQAGLQRLHALSPEKQVAALDKMELTLTDLEGSPGG